LHIRGSALGTGYSTSDSMTINSALYNVVYHVATLNHWRDVLRGQMELLGRNRCWNSLTVSIGCGDVSSADEVVAIIKDLLPGSNVRFHRSPLERFEHGAMALVDELAEQDLPILYFHAKAVSYSPINPFAETWRKYLNRIVTEADQWARFLIPSQYDACGQLMVHDASHGYTYFAGNFWMAKSQYLRKLSRYEDFAGSPIGNREPFDRHFAELAVNRSKVMRGFAIDGSSLTPDTMCAYLHKASGGGSRQ
jgi:hypothetical protein